jgi:N-dimethylarginine dimethylaminohydrolase
MQYGSQSMVRPLRRVIVKRPEEAWIDQATIDAQWESLNFIDRPDFARACEEHKRFVEILRASGAEVLMLDRDSRTNLDSIYTHDPGIVTEHGAIVFQTGKELRRGESSAMAKDLEKWGIPVLATIGGDATAEGGDMLWLDRNTLLVGQGFRTNAAGIAAIRSVLKPFDINVLEFHLPYGSGPRDVLHEMSFVSMLDDDLAIVFLPLMPVPLFQLLQERRVRMVEVAATEFVTLACNVLTLSPRDVLMVDGNPLTREILEAEGCRVQEFSGWEIANKGSGGPTCLTRPLLRS